MKGKIFTIFALAILMFSLMGTFALAEEHPTVAQEDEPTGVFWDKVQRAFTFNKEKKSEISLRIADKHALRAGKLVEKGDRVKSLESIEEHGKEVEKAEEHFDDVATDGDEESVKRALRATVRMQERLQIHKEKFIAVHSRILERQSDRISKERLDNLNEIFSKVEDRTAEAEARIAQKQENLIARYKVLTGATDEEVEALMEEFRAEFAEMREKRIERIREQKDTIRIQRDKIINDIRIYGDRDVDSDESEVDSIDSDELESSRSVDGDVDSIDSDELENSRSVDGEVDSIIDLRQ